MSAPELLLGKFVELSGQRITLSAMRMEVLAEMARRGFIAADVELVYRWVKQQIGRNEGGYNVASLQFGAMLGRSIADVDKFEDKLEVAKQSRLGRRLAEGKGAVLSAQCLVTKEVAAPRISSEEEERRRARRKTELEDFNRRMGR